MFPQCLDVGLKGEFGRVALNDYGPNVSINILMKNRLVLS
jgi:hypothetical protein